MQLAHACLASGYDAVVPASWGDELIAARVVDRMRGANAPFLQCSCPLVADRLATHGDAIEDALLRLVAPPVATAAYLRALFAPSRLRVSFAGACAAGADQAIDAWLSPGDLIAGFAQSGIVLDRQPMEFDSVLPPDRRRFFSEPGGIPSLTALRQVSPMLECVEIGGASFVTDLAQCLFASQCAVIDASVALGCMCSGAVGAARDRARASVREHEPPRAPSPVVDHSVPVVLDAKLDKHSVLPVRPQPTFTPPAAPLSSDKQPAEVEAAVVAVEPPRRRSPQGMRPVLGTVPRSRTATGRPLPRAYVARRRSSPRGTEVDPALMASDGSIGRSAKRPWIWIGLGILAGLALSWLAGLAR